MEFNHKINKNQLCRDIAYKSMLRFLTVMSDQIRRPLNTIMGLSQVINNNHLDNDTKHHLNLIYNECHQIVPLLEHCDYLLSLQNKSYQPNSTVFDLREMIENVILEKYKDISEQSISILLDYSLNVPCKVIGEANNIEKVVRILLENAIKYSRQGDVKINVDFNKENDYNFTINIVDHGPGIAQENLQGIFDLFAIGDNLNYCNSGTKLSICKHIINSIGGDISITSKKNRGTLVSLQLSLDLQKNQKHLEQSLWTFYQDKLKVLILNDDIAVAKYLYHYLPITTKQFSTVTEATPLIEQAHVDGEPFNLIVLDDDTLEKNVEIISAMFLDAPYLKDIFFMVISESEHNRFIRMLQSEVQVGIIRKPLLPSKLNRDFLFNWMHFKNAQCLTLDDFENNCPEPSILLVEDDHANRLVEKMMLEKLGCKVDVAIDGEQAVTMIDQSGKQYDLVIMDIGLPGKSGLEIAPMIKSSIANEYDLPMVAMTAYSSEKDKMKCLEAGMNDMLTKPVLMKDLEHLLKQYIPASVCEVV